MLILAAALALATAQGAPPAAVRQHVFADLALSPGAERTASVEYDDDGDPSREPHQAIALRDATGGQVIRRIDPCPGCRYHDLTFSADGETLAFMAQNRVAGTTTLYLANAAGVTARASLNGVAQKPRWSPDGRTIGFLAVVGAHKEVGATQAAAPQVGEIGEAPDEQRIAVVAAAGKEPLRLVSPADTFVYEYDWTPDGKGFVATAAKGDGDNNWWVADLEGVDLATGAAHRIAKPADQLNDPRISPDGAQVAFIGGLMSDFGSVGGDLYLVPTGGGTPVDLTPGFKGSFTSLAWRKGRILATALIGDKAALVAADPKTGKIETLWSAPLSVEGGDGRILLDAKGETAASIVQDYEHAPEIAVAPIAGLGFSARITRDNAALPAAGSARSVEWTSEGRTVQGWLLSPTKTDPGKTYPMLTIIHGGPSAATTPTYVGFVGRSVLTRELLAKGYFVFEPNPRGSYGQGEAFTRANVRDFGGGDLRDILAGVDAVEKIAPVDDKRLGVYGHSYGGFMTMWTVTHTSRFHAAIAGAGIANWISYYGENGIDQWMVPFFGASAYDDPAIYEKLSPLASIKNARTPTFIYVGERDVECPAPQSVEFWHAMKTVGAPAKLLILEGEGHGIRAPEHIKQLNDDELGWLDHYLGDKAGE
ncbi:S9 family peptidase [Phenylobacterium montanum]|uniref:S9 family peptidase n=1 Tax=Phenylobacterium montanum TaxID=2823693 RepID=A0A975IUH5_9CAUL|nr:S9 family peptidase [Caulobacter sp. S6]QUD87947.1 S9 family peptidase [Caulobacter sp. S6]